MRIDPFQRTLLVLLALFVLPIALSPPARAQDVASITGVISDPSGAVIAGARVILQNTSTGATYNAVSNAQGSYTIPNAAPGPGYSLTISHSGFTSSVITGLYLNVNSTRAQNVALSVGHATQTVEVSAASQNQTINTTDATIGNNFQVSMLNDLPIQNRDSPAALFYQQPGVTLAGSVSGARTDQSNVIVDGLEMNDDATGTFAYIVGGAPVDSVQEFRAVVGDPLSGPGQGSGGQFVLVTKSGTNQFHGNINEYHRDTDTEANDWFNNNAGVPRPPLVRNQFGGNIGGPIRHDKAFFFFDYDGRRDARSLLVDRTVPLGSNSSGYRGGEVAYVNSSGSVSTLSPTQVAALDPQGIGWDQAELKLFQSRYPCANPGTQCANDLTGDVGDLVNTAGYRFNAPNPYVEDVYVGRIDYTLNDKMKLFAKTTVNRTNSIEYPIQFPGDPTYTFPFDNRSYDWTIGHTWTISQNLLNQAQIGESYEDFGFPVTYNPQGLDQYTFAGLSGPYNAGNGAQARTFPVPIFREDFTWLKDKHTFSFGGTFKWESPTEFADENYNLPYVGVTGNTYFTALSDDQRPADINPADTTIYDTAFSTALGAVADVYSNFNYNNKGTVLAQASGLSLNYRNYQTELYFADAWKITPNLTLTYGLRYQNYTVPYEVNGDEAVPQLASGSTVSPFSFNSYWSARVKQSAAGIATDTALPFVQYIYGGKANHAMGYYQPNNKDFAPHFGFAFSPGFDKSTVFSGSAGIVYDHTVVDALQFLQLQYSGLFEASNTNLFGTNGDPTASLASSSPAAGGLPRFAGISSPPPAPAPPTISAPYTPYVYNDFPYGLEYGELNIVIDPTLKDPYSIEYDFGVQHQFPHGYLLKMDFDSRLGRRLLAEADASQLLDFPDNTGGSNQTMAQAEAAMVTQLRQYSNLGAFAAATQLSAQPWFEDMLAGYATYLNSYYGGNYFANNTQAAAYVTAPYSQRGDLGDMIYVLSGSGFLSPNVGMASQYGDNTVWTNKGFSDYDGLLVTLHKNTGYGLSFDFNYTWSHSIDNVSVPANFLASSQAYGYICDVTRPRECRGNSDFDVTNYFNGNFIYELPFGRGRSFAASLPLWANEAIGGWELSGIPTWHTGLPYNALSNAYIASFANDAPATLIGSPGLLKAKLQGGQGHALNAYSNSSAALAAFTGPTGLNIGSRNNLRGPGFFNLDLGLGKAFPLSGDRVNLKFRCDAFNALNHPNFAYPGQTINGVVTGSADITESNGIPFGTIGSTVTSPGSDISARVLQGALRLEF